MIKTISKNDPRASTEIDEYIGKKLRLIRLNKGFSQEDLGASLDLTFTQIQKYENAKNRIAASRLYEISKLLDVSLYDFFKGSAPKRQSWTEELLTPQHLRILRLIDILETPEKKDLAIRLIKVLK